MYKKILFATDNSIYSKKALPHLLEIAENHNAEVLLFNAYYIPDYFKSEEENHYIYFEKMEKNMIEHGNKILAEVEQSLEEKNISSKIVLNKGPVGPAIVETANNENCDLIIIGTRGLGKIRNPLISSVTNYVVNNAKCSLLLVQ